MVVFVPLSYCCFWGLELGAWPGVPKRYGYIWLFVERILSILLLPLLLISSHMMLPSMYQIDTVLTRAWHRLTCIEAFFKYWCLSVSSLAASHLFASFTPHTPCSMLQKGCVPVQHVCVEHCGGNLSKVQKPGNKFTLVVLAALTLIRCFQYLNELRFQSMHSIYKCAMFSLARAAGISPLQPSCPNKNWV